MECGTCNLNVLGCVLMPESVESYISEEVVGRGSVQQMLADAIRDLLERQADGAQGSTVRRLFLPVEPVDPFVWLQAQDSRTKLFWAGRHDSVITAAIGTAHSCTAVSRTFPDAIEKQLIPLRDSGARYYGGIRFDPLSRTGVEWEAFGAYRFILPRFELVTREGQAALACNLVLPNDVSQVSAILQEALRLVFPVTSVSKTLPLPSSRNDTPGRKNWNDGVNWALEAFRRSELDKVVLARRVTYTFDRALEPIFLLEQLRSATPGCFHFCFIPNGEDAFLGASPERLFRREGKKIWSEAVAGTRPRGDSLRDDQRLRDELLLSDKDQREHEYVRRSILETLEPLSESLEVDKNASEMILARGRHLYSAISGQLVEPITELELLARLHPTPAVGGYPTEVALRVIRDLESFDRGWYAGAVGWIGAEDSEFAVAIRSGLVRNRELILHAGAGIVQGSIPEKEWEEIEQKLGDFTSVLGLEN